jgi:AraC family transcriptional regulator
MQSSSTPVERALWFIENRLSGEVSLRDIASAAGVTPNHLARAFAAATGQSLMQYVRGRRLTEAARALASGADNILVVALDAGYSSHGAFTRAFHEQFGATPEMSRDPEALLRLQPTEPLRMDKSMLIELDPPRFEKADTILIAGLGARYTFATNEGIPTQWRRFGPHIGNVPGQVGRETFGVACNFDAAGTFEYITGVRVRDFAEIPADFSTLAIAPASYAVFVHPGHVSALRRTHYTIWNKWAPESGKKITSSPNFEKYGQDFDPVTGRGMIEIWMPVDD